jgi:hypothetical protein
VNGNAKVLRGKPDESLTWLGKDITLGYPNYAAGVDLGSRSSYTATSDGWILVHLQTTDTDWHVKVNNATVGYEGGEHWQHTSEFLPVKKGDVVTSSQAASYIFYPNR